MNTVVLFGRLGGDVVLDETQSGTKRARFSIADDRGKDKDALWWHCTAFGQRAELLASVRRGHRLVVTGRADLRDWTTRDGEAKTSLELLVDGFSYVETRAEAEGDGGQRQERGGGQQRQQQARGRDRDFDEDGGGDPFDER